MNGERQTGGQRYTSEAYRSTEGTRIWKEDGGYLSYDGDGNLWINDLRVIDAIRMYGSPLEIVDTTIIEDRCKKWQELSQTVARQVGYDPALLEYFYAAKANMSAEIAAAAYRSGWNAETSGDQDLEDIRWMEKQGLIDKNKTRIICNGFKLPPQVYSLPEENPTDIRSRVKFEDSSQRMRGAFDGVSYAENITLMKSLGFDITPILDEGELYFFAQANEVPQMDVGLRFKMGKVSNMADLSTYVSRHGMSWEQIQTEADTIDRIDHLNLKIFHAMVGAAETMPVDTFVEQLLFAADRYFDLRQRHPSLDTFNMGGGMPPLGEKYDHKRFLKMFLGGMKQMAEARGLPTPRISFEFGSYVASEAGFHAFKLVTRKSNNVDANGNPETWALGDLGLMAAIPDMLVIGKTDFRFLAVNNANAKAIPVRIGDLTCDSDGRWPSKIMEPAKVMVPDVKYDQYMVVGPVGAYQEILAGIRGAHHCGVLEAAELIIERRSDGTHGRLMPRQTRQEARDLLGYDQESLLALRSCVGKS